jgi:Protein of unknown function (DUF2505)
VRFELEHPLAASPGEVAAALLDLGFQRSLSDVSEAIKAREVLSQEEGPDGSVIRRVRCVLGIDLGAAARFVGGGEPAWVEEARFDPASLTWTWTIHPEVGGDMLTADGTTTLLPEGSGTRRRVEGEVKVRVPLYGGRVERWIVGGLTEAYAEEAIRLDRFLGSNSGDAP